MSNIEIITIHPLSTDGAIIGSFVSTFNGVFMCVTETVNDLVIVRVSKHSGTCKGGDEVFLLCEKVNKGKCHVNRICTN